MSEVNNYDIHIHQGETWEMTVDILDSNDDPKSLSGYSAWMDVRKAPGGKLYTSLTSSDSDIVITEAEGEIEINMPASSTAGLPFVEAYYDLALKSGTGNVTYILKGKVIVERRITEVP